MKLIAWIGSLCFAVCALPQAIQSIQTGNSNGLSWGMLSLWGIGELCMLVFAIFRLKSSPMIFNYVCNFICLLVIIFYKAYPI